ncbi:hypothetical protein UlMin_032143 [Ulmus minor]
MYEGVATSVRSVGGMSSEFPISVILHQWLALSPYLFALIMDKLIRHLQDDIPWCILFNGVIREDVDHKIKSGWTKWSITSRVLCNRRMHASYAYDSECWATTKKHMHKMAIADMSFISNRKSIAKLIPSLSFGFPPLHRCLRQVVFRASGLFPDFAMANDDGDTS